MAAVLYPEFTEIGRSGRLYSRQQILDELSSKASLPTVEATDFSLTRIDEAVWLLTYRPAHIDDNGRPCRHSLRSSIWLQTDKGFQLRFHQGTATE